MPLPRVLIIGATNVGKSQLFNRLVKDRHSIVLDQTSLTRDLVMREIELKPSQKILLIDGGGYSDQLETHFQSEINRLLIDQIREASILLFVFSKVEGIRPIERKISKLIHRYSRGNVIVVANKIDSKKGEEGWRELSSSLGFNSFLEISAEHNINISDLRKKISSFFPEVTEKRGEENKEYLKIGIVGKVNVGKSSLVNALLNSNLVIVSPIAGTTIDLVEHSLCYKGNNYLLIDSPGWKKMKKEGIRNEQLDYLSFVRSQKAIKLADILLFMIDSSSELDHLDERVAKEIFDSNLPLVIVINKWDLIEYLGKKSEKKKKYSEKIRRKFYFLSWAPIVFISAKESRELDSIFKSLELVKKEKERLFSNEELGSFLGRISLFLMGNSKPISLYGMTQVKSSIPTFVINCSNPDNLDVQQLRLVESQLRNSLNLFYSPIKIYYKKSK